jgi:hypothetical protein
MTLAEPIVRSLQDEHFTCLNYALLQQLGTIGQALYMRCFFHFANLYTGVQKRYDDICGEWLDVTDTDLPSGFNPLAGVAPGRQALAASGIVSAFKHLWADSWGPRLEHWLFQGVASLIATQRSTLIDFRSAGARLLVGLRGATVPLSP